MSDIEWTGDAMAYALAHVAAGVIQVDGRGRLWRAMKFRGSAWVSTTKRRAENPGGKGYLRLSLGVPGTRKLAIVMAHRLVYFVKVGPIPHGLQINHKDLDKRNNEPSNLEVVTASQNIMHSYANGRNRPWFQCETWRGKKRLSRVEIEEIKAMRRGGAALKAVAAEFSISVGYVSVLCTR